MTHCDSGEGAGLSGSSLRFRLERDLHRGDLRVLSHIASGRVDGPDFGQVDRLCERGFLAMTRKGRARTTLKGWIAILLQRTIARRDHHADRGKRKSIARSQSRRTSRLCGGDVRPHDDDAKSSPSHRIQGRIRPAGEWSKRPRAETT